MTDTERAKAMMAEVGLHLNAAIARCTEWAAQLAEARARIKDLETPAPKTD